RNVGTLGGMVDVRRHSPTRTALIAGLVIICFAVAGYGGTYWYLVGRFHEATDDAYLQADIFAVSSQVQGVVTDLPVEDNQPVKQGDILAQIDDANYRARLQQAQADLAGAQATLTTLEGRIGLQQSAVAEATAKLAAAEASLRFSRLDQSR